MGKRLSISPKTVGFDKRSALVTVVIPTHNYGRYLPEAIESALAQTYQNIEVIVVDDGSTDNTRNIVANYQAVYYVYQEHKGNLTPARAMNLGIKLSHGEYISCIGADDKLLPKYIEKCVSEIQKDSRIGFVWTGKQEFGESEQVYMPRKLRYRSSILGGAGGALGAMLMKREACVNTLYDERLHGREDWDKAIRMMNKGWKWKTIQEPLYIARVHEENLTLAVHQRAYVHELEEKYPLMRLYSTTHGSFKALVLFFKNPRLFLKKLWSRRLSKYFGLRQLPQ